VLDVARQGELQESDGPSRLDDLSSLLGRECLPPLSRNTETAQSVTDLPVADNQHLKPVGTLTPIVRGQAAPVSAVIVAGAVFNHDIGGVEVHDTNWGGSTWCWEKYELSFAVPQLRGRGIRANRLHVPSVPILRRMRRMDCSLHGSACHRLT
jgi:hypothetical protein